MNLLVLMGGKLRLSSVGRSSDSDSICFLLHVDLNSRWRSLAGPITYQCRLLDIVVYLLSVLATVKDVDLVRFKSLAA